MANELSQSEPVLKLPGFGIQPMINLTECAKGMYKNILTGALLISTMLAGAVNECVAQGVEKEVTSSNRSGSEFCAVLVRKDSNEKVSFRRLAGSQSEMRFVKIAMGNANLKFSAYRCDQMIVLSNAIQAKGKLAAQLARLREDSKDCTFSVYYVYDNRTIVNGESVDVSELTESKGQGTGDPSPPDRNQAPDSILPSGDRPSAPHHPPKGPSSAEPGPAPK